MFLTMENCYYIMIISTYTPCMQKVSQEEALQQKERIIKTVL